MIQVTVYEDSNKLISEFLVEGHAGYGKNGSDIICASVSMLVINTINSIEHFTEDSFRCDADEKTGMIHFTFTGETSAEAQLLLRSMMLGLQDVEKEYGRKYLRILLREV